MFDYIIKLFDDNKYVGYLIIFILLIIVIKLTVTYKYEYYTNSEESSDLFSKYYANTNINLVCKIPGDDREYYLVNLKMDEYNTTTTTEKCNTGITVLMERKKIDEDLKKYDYDMETDKIICIEKNKAICIRSETTAPDSCAEEYQECTNKRNYIHDFHIQPILNSDTKLKSYYFRGTLIPQRNNSSEKIILNQFLYSTLNINKLCSDMSYYIDDETEKHHEIHVDVISSDTSQITDNLQSSEIMAPDIKIKLYFYKNIIIPNGTGFLQIRDNNNNPTYEKSYIGVCESSDKIKLSDGTKVHRICLYPENQSDNILEFTPIII